MTRPMHRLQEITDESRFYVLWRAGKVVSPITGEDRFAQYTPTFPSFGQLPDSILVYSDYERMFGVLFQLSTMNEFANDPIFKELFIGYEPVDYIRSFSAKAVAEFWDCHNLLLDFTAAEITLLLTYNEKERTRWLLELPDSRALGVPIIGGMTWAK